MIWRVLIIGGYGHFGSFITKTLAKDANIQVIVAGRCQHKAQLLVSQLAAANRAEAVALDITDNFIDALQAIKANIVIHTSGPFQQQDYRVAKACIEQGVHYLDLADARKFVAGIVELNEAAKAKNVLVISGASSVPCFTSALVDYYLPEFESLETLDYGITTAQKTTRGVATTAAILDYTGKPFLTRIDGQLQPIYGWQNLRARKYPGLGWRLLGHCDVPDLDLFPARYPTLKTIRFYAGIEIGFIHLTLWGLSWLVRFGLIKQLKKMAPALLKISFLFDWIGSSDSGFHMVLSGSGKTEPQKTIRFELTAKSGDGPNIPCMPAILMTQKLIAGEIKQVGAYPCIGFITRDEYLNALMDKNITWQAIELNNHRIKKL